MNIGSLLIAGVIGIIIGLISPKLLKRLIKYLYNKFVANSETK